MDLERAIALTVAATAPLSVIAAGIWRVVVWWGDRHPPATQVVQGQTITPPPADTAALAAFLERELDEAQAALDLARARKQAYREALVRAGVDPRAVLHDAGLAD